MDVTRFGAARPYDAPGHHGMVGLRLQGWEVSETGAFWTGFSQFLPGGGATADATPLEKVYVVIDGELTIIENRSNRTASMLVTMPYPEGRS
jgi:hypothetical protein